MAHAVFIHRSDSIYEDSPAEQYQFPPHYRTRAEASVGDWIVYYQPRKAVATRGYYAVAQIDRITPDPSNAAMFLAIVKSGSYLEFPTSVPFTNKSGVVERGILNEAGRISGRAQAAIRPLSHSDFARIVDLGLRDEQFLPRDGGEFDHLGFNEEQAHFIEQPRDRIVALSSRPVRDRIFRRIVLRAYDERCALSGLKLINGGGRAEVAAAHIRPVQANGPDIVSNGLALSGTAHWMFDRGLISLSDNLAILISRQANDIDAIRSFINNDGQAALPRLFSDRPHPSFLSWHRENCFKQ